MLINLIFLTIIISSQISINAIQSNSSCALEPRDKRQLVCQCSKKLHLLCVFNIDIREISSKDLDKTLIPISYEEVSLERSNSFDPNNPLDLNINFEKFVKNSPKRTYIYFPNFNVLNSAFNRIYFLNFIFIPSFGFYDKSSFLREHEIGKFDQTQSKFVHTIVFELPEVYDFGIDRFAFYGLKNELLILEGPFDYINIHKDAFFNSNIEELNIGCYCLECDKNNRNCIVNFNQESDQEVFSIDDELLNESVTFIGSLKLYGIKLSDSLSKIWNIDDLPSIQTLKKLEIVNSILDKIQETDNGIELSSFKKNTSYPNLNELIFRNNGLRIFTNRMFKIFPNIKILDLSQNEIEKLLDNSLNLEKDNHLIELHLERNQIKSIEKYLFSSLHNLKYLNLKENKIDNLEDFAFQSLSKLETLDLSRNKITTLTEQTFIGLDSLQDLTISHNPLKNIASDTFKYLGNHSPLKRVEMISNADLDWFVFDDTDICILVYFKCGVQIEIDHDQTCNCFVKYSNLIGHDEKGENNADSSSTEKSLFKPCTIETKFTNTQANRYENEEKENLSAPKFECPKSFLQNCYSKYNNLDLLSQNHFLNNSSCLFNKVLEPNGTSKKKSLDYTNSLKEFNFSDKKIMEAVINQEEINQKTDKKHSDITEIGIDQKEINGLVTKQQVVKQKNSTMFFNKIEITLDQKLKFILIGLAFLSIISMFSFSIACYLLCKSKKIQYHLAESTKE